MAMKLNINPTRIRFSFVKNVRRAKPVTITLEEFIDRKMPKYRHLVEAYREEKDIEIKTNLPAIIPAGILKGGQKKEDIQFLTGYASFDIDYIDPKEVEKVKARVAELPFVFLVMRSTGGSGLWGMVRFAKPAYYQWHYNSLIQAFAEVGIDLDISSTDIVRKRFVTWDDDVYLAREAEVFEEMTPNGPVKSQDGSTRDYFHRWEVHRPSQRLKIRRFNEAVTCEEVLSDNGWSYSYTDKGGTRRHYLRPGSSSHAASGNINEKGLFWCHTSATELPPGMLYKPFDLFVYLEHGGDIKSALLNINKKVF